MVTRTGSWATSWTNYTTALSFGSSLLLPAAGVRSNMGYSLIEHGSAGYYWASTDSYFLTFNNTRETVRNDLGRTGGYSIRCISE